jgi:hypothetical protein
MNQPSKQRKWQKEQIAKRLCTLCNEPLSTTQHCAEHAEGKRARERNRYRKAKGIPLEAPLYHRKHHELEKKSTFLQRLSNLLFRS